MADLFAQEIFASGTWNGLTFNDKDLDNIVMSFNELRDIHHAPLKLGHNKEQKITDGQPALGWVKRVYRQGGKLLADFSDVPTVVAKAIKKKLYRKVSVELLFDAIHQGKKLPLVLDAVALLGAEHPAVSSLKDLEVLAMHRAPFAVSGVVKSFSAIAGTTTSREGLTMDADVQKAFDDLRSQVADITKAVTTFTKKEPEESDDVKQLRADNAALKEKADAADKDKANFARQGINAIFDEAVTAKKITPAQRELFSKQLGIDDDKRVVELKQEDVRTMVGVIAKEDGKDKTNGGQAFTRQDGGNDEGYDKNKADEEVGRRVRALQATTQGLTFSRAMEQVLRDDKELATAYRDVTRNRSSATV